MNKKVIQNINGKATVTTTFRGRTVTLKPKHSMTLDFNLEEDRALYRHLLSTYHFIIDRTAIFAKESIVEDPVTLQKTFFQELVNFIHEKAPKDYLKRILYTDNSVTIEFGNKKRGDLN